MHIWRMLFVLVIAAIVVSAIAWIATKKEEPKNEAPIEPVIGPPVDENQPVIPPEPIIELPKTLEQKIAECAAFQQLTQRDSCFANLASTERNSGICDNIQGTSVAGKSPEEQKKECMRTVERIIAIDSKNSTNCLALEIDFDEWLCLKALAVDQDNDSLCAQITDPLKRFDCYTAVAEKTGNEKICDYITTSSVRSNCVGVVAARKKDSGLCSTIDGTAEKENCLLKVAVATNDSSICNLLTLAPYKEQCIKETG